MALFLCIVAMLVKIGAGEISLETDDVASAPNIVAKYTNKFIFEADFSVEKAKMVCTATGLSYKLRIPTERTTYFVCADEDAYRRKKRDITERNVAIETTLRKQNGVSNVHQEVKVPVKLGSNRNNVNIIDEHWSYTWHLQPYQYPNMYIYDAWNLGYNGSGVIIGVCDSGMDTDHPDLVENYLPNLSYDFLDFDTDPAHSDGDNGHGTKTAGIVASVKNDLCSLGVAYGAKFAVIRIIDTGTEDIFYSGATSSAALIHQLDKIDIYSNSWNFATEGKYAVPLENHMKDSLETGIKRGRGGKGAIYVFIAGNDENDYDDANLQEIKRSIYTITIGSVSSDGTPAYYSTPGACLLAATYGGDLQDKYIGITTTDKEGQCTHVFQGTSAAGPVASGIIAMALQANPNLTWRDIQHLIVESSSVDGLSGNTFVTNGAGFTASDYFGFGLMNAERMVDKAKTWKSVGEQKTCDTIRYPTYTPSSYGDIVSRLLVRDCNIDKLEHVEVRADINTTCLGNMTIYLTSPVGTRSRLRRQLPYFDLSGYYYSQFMSTHFWGENPQGPWTLTLEDNFNTDKELLFWNMTLYGTAELYDTTDTAYHSNTHSV